MDSDNEKDFPDSGVEPKSKDDDDFESSRSDENRLFVTQTLRAEKSGYWAELDVEYFWNANGTSFDCRAKRYRAKSGGSLTARLWFSLYQEPRGSTTGYSTNQNASQNGNWFNLSLGANIPIGTRAARIGFTFTYQASVGGIVVPIDLEVARYVGWDVSAPTIQTSGTVPTSNFEVVGTGGVTGATLIIYEYGGGEVGRTPVTGSGWKVNVAMPSGQQSMQLQAIQVINGTQSPGSNIVTVSLALFATISAPTEGATVRIENLVFTGTTNPGANIVVVRNDDHYKNLTESKVEPSGNWNRPLLSTVMLPSGPLKVEAQYSLGSHGYSPVRTVNIQSYPILSTPPAGSEQEQTFTVTGTGGRPGAMLYIQKDQDPSTVYGSTLVSTNSWSVQATLPPGRQTITPEQVMGGVRSTPGDPRTFVIKPAPVTGLAHAVDANSTLTLSGLGHIGATVNIHVTGNGTPVASVEVRASSWSTQILNWLPGKGISLDIRQRVADSAGGWIYSGWTNLTFDVPVPPPNLRVEVSANGTPRFFGTAKYWPNQPAPQVEVRIDSTSVPIVPIVPVSPGGTWSSTAQQPWVPRIEPYKVVAQMAMGDQLSRWTDAIDVVIPFPTPLAPTIEPVDENGLSPRFRGECETGAIVTLTFTHPPTTPVNATVSGQTWSHERSQPFPEGVQFQVTATQTVDGVTSPATTREFTVYAPRLKPVITTPVQNEEVDSDLTVNGNNGMAGASMQLWDARDKKPLGAPVTLSQDGAWAIALKGLTIDSWYITAQQTLRGRPSEHSEILELQVVVMPPEFWSPPPTGGDLPRTSTLSGKGRPNGRVTVWCKGILEPLLRDVLIDPNGIWAGSVTLEVGSRILWATQTFEGKTSKPSLEVPCRFVPRAVFAESPTPEERLGKTVTVSGFGFPGDRITLKQGNAALGEAPVLPDRTWSITATLAPPDGAVTLSLVASSGDFHSAPSEWVSQLGLYMPEFTKPVAGQWGSPAMTFAGLGKPGSGTLMTWYNPDVVLAAPVAVTQTGWTTGSTQPLTPGGHWCRFWQSFSTGTPISDCSESGRFDVRIDSSDK